MRLWAPPASPSQPCEAAAYSTTLGLQRTALHSGCSVQHYSRAATYSAALGLQHSGCSVQHYTQAAAYSAAFCEAAAYNSALKPQHTTLHSDCRRIALHSVRLQAYNAALGQQACSATLGLQARSAALGLQQCNTALGCRCTALHLGYMSKLGSCTGPHVEQQVLHAVSCVPSSRDLQS